MIQRKAAIFVLESALLLRPIMNLNQWKQRDGYFIYTMLLRLLAVYGLLMMSRAIFYLYNQTAFGEVSLGELAGMFFYALRFDSSALVYVNSLFIVLSMLPIAWRYARWYNELLFGVFMASNATMLLIELSDVVYFPFSFRRILRSDFDMQQDIWNMLPQFFHDFWWLIFSGIGSLIASAWWYRRTMQYTAMRGTGLKFYSFQMLLLLLTAGVGVVAMRGGLQPRPITSLSAAQYTSNVRATPLITNATLNLIHSFQQRQIARLSYFDEATLKNFTTISEFSSHADTAQRKLNVVVIIMESFGREYISHFNPTIPKLTPFYDSLCQQSVVFTQAHANGTRSAQGIVAITSGLPALMQDPFMFSSYQNNHLSSLASHLASWGYHTSFFHGGHNGTMAFDTYTKLVGYKDYIGHNEYEQANGTNDDDGNWGIWDVPFFNNMLRVVRTYQQPFLATFFSLNPHHPFHVPADFGAKYPNERAEYQAIRYADYALAQFFEQARKEAWFDNTLFVITGDHIGAAFDTRYSIRAHRYQVPILLYAPKWLQPSIQPQFAEQIDIMPTVLRWVGYPTAFRAFGRDLFAPATTPNFNYTFDSGMYQILDSTHALHFNGTESVGLFAYKQDSLLQDNLLTKSPSIKQMLENQLKAMLQVHNDAMFDNTLP